MIFTHNGIKSVGLFLALVLLVIVMFISSMGSAMALPLEQRRVQDSGARYFNVREGAAGACSGAETIPTSVDLPKGNVDAINALRDVYVKAGEATNVPWQVLAGIHYREGTNNPKKDLQAGNEIGKGGPYFSDQGAQPDIQTSAINAGKHLQDKAKSGIFKKEIDAKNPDPELIKDALFGYNGRAKVYAQQAATLGFNPETQPYEGSPYVMNMYDEKHKNMRMITRDFGGLDGTDLRLGAFTIYAALAGVSGGNCGSGPSGSKIVDIAKAELNKGVKEVPKGSNSGPDVLKYTDGVAEFWCADFVSWVYKEAGVPFSGGLSGGWRISYVPTLVSWLKTNGMYTTRAENKFPPLPGDVVIIGGGAATDSSGAEGHTGIVYEVSGTTLVSIDGNYGDAVSKVTYVDYLSNPKVTGWGRHK